MVWEGGCLEQLLYLFLSLGGTTSLNDVLNLPVLVMNLNKGFRHLVSLRMYLTWCAFVPSDSLRVLCRLEKALQLNR
jgi:hypothetical protein